MTDKKLQDEKDVPMFQYNSTLAELNKITKDEKAKLDQQIVIAKSNLSQLRQEHIRLQGEFNQWKMGEEQKFKNDLSKRHNQLIDQENKMNMFHKDIEQRKADLVVKEERYINIDKDRNAIGNARVEVEKMRVAAMLLMDEASRKMSEASSATTQSSLQIEQSKKLDQKNDLRNQQLCVREDQLKFDLKNLEMERNHLIELRDFVEPKIKNIKEIEDNILEARKEIDFKHQDVLNKSEENKIIIKSLEDRKIQLDRREMEIRSKEDEVKRKILIHETTK